MSLTVLSIAYPFARLSRNSVGGAEQILSMVDEALVNAGHRSIVIACRGSDCAGELVPLPIADDGDLSAYESWHAQHEACRAAIRRILRRERVDVVHAHGLDFDSYTRDLAVPLLATIHLRPSCYPPDAFVSKRRFVAAFVSEAQRRSAGAVSCCSVVIPNGIRLERFHFSEHKNDMAVALGRISPEKGFHFALDACVASNTALSLAGKVFPYREHLDYFEKEIRPRLDAQRRFLGPVFGSARAELLASGKCLIVSSTVPETSSLVAMEAAASGTPVVAVGIGAVPEVVRDGVSGIVVDGPNALAAAIQRAGEISPRQCREVAEREFSADRMCARYLEVFESLC
jgi:glycosyltransferase involved in cell wall biosynthesis